jgi:DNA-binding beta-propeller fold protein YncE
MQSKRNLQLVFSLFILVVALPPAIAQVVTATVPVGTTPVGVAVNSVTNKI